MPDTKIRKLDCDYTALKDICFNSSRTFGGVHDFIISKVSAELLRRVLSKDPNIEECRDGGLRLEFHERVTNVNKKTSVPVMYWNKTMRSWILHTHYFLSAPNGTIAKGEKEVAAYFKKRKEESRLKKLTAIKSKREYKEK